MTMYNDKTRSIAACIAAITYALNCLPVCHHVAGIGRSTCPRCGLVRSADRLRAILWAEAEV